MAPTVPNIKLNSGYEMPQVGFGLWKVDNDLAADTVYNAIKVGYRLFDGACGKQHTYPAPWFDGEFGLPRTDKEDQLGVGQWQETEAPH